MKIRSAARAMAIAAGVISCACSGCSSNSSGGPGTSGNGAAPGSGGTSGGSNSAGTGGLVGAGQSSGGGPQGDSCASVRGCGGSVVGTWKVSASCLKVSGNLDLSLVGAGCPTAAVTGSLEVTGTWTASSNGTYTDNTTTTGQEQFNLAPTCLVISSTQTDCPGAANIISSLGYSSVTCTAATGGGCNCTATVHQNGGLGLVSNIASSTGNYAVSDSVITIDAQAPYAYCASASAMTWTPQTNSPATSGAIAFEKAGGASAGGAGGMGEGGTSSTGAGAGGTSAGGGLGGSGMAGGGTAGSGMGGAGNSTAPCDIYKGGGTPCVAAHSTVRALFGTYGGKLYQVRNAAGTTKDILALAPGGVADGASQDAFCSGTSCVITIVYDQSGKGNDLQYQGPGSVPGGKDAPASATGESLKVFGNKVYSLYIKPGNSYWVDGSTKGVPTGAAPEGMYMVTSGTHYNSGCCFDYGNSETGRAYKYPGAMDALNFSNTTSWGTGAGTGPWVMADLEAGLFAGPSGKGVATNPTQTATFVTAILKNNGTTEYALRGGNATTGNLSTYYKGALPGGWSPMKKEGALVLGSGGDCCNTNANQSQGTFYEGCIVSGYPSDATENAIQANIVAAGYSK